MNIELDNSGRRVAASFSDENVREIFLPLLRRLTALRRARGRRVVALLAAPPGAGKSTLAALLEALSERTPGLERLTALGMDGFHHRQDYLRAHTTVRGGARVPLASVKGAPESFDLDRLRAALSRVAAGEDCGWPRYDRALHDPVDDAIRVTGGIVLVEGNYLLLDAPGWRELRGFADYTIAIAADPAKLRGRLVARHVAGGKSEAEAAAFVDASDLANARLCLERSLPADLTLQLTDDDAFRAIGRGDAREDMPMRYRSLFAEIGKGEREIDAKIEAAFRAIFEDEEERFYFEPDDLHGYMLDTGNVDARTEGMSYGMMMAVQMDRKDIFDRLWRFSCDYMLLREGPHAGYFAWSVRPDGAHNAEGPAPDGEEYFAMALLFAAARWGEGEPPLDYAAQARTILRHCVHQPELAEGGRAMWYAENHLIRFVPEVDFSDPSYHLPHFYALFARACDPADADFWRRAAAASRDYIAKACHPATGLAPEYAEYDGSTRLLFGKGMAFFSDAYRVAMNIGLDAAWFGATPALSRAVDRLQATLDARPELLETACQLDGTPEGTPVMHPLGLLATTAAGSLATQGEAALRWARRLWEAQPRRGARRYYDNCLYFFSLLMAAGRYVNWMGD